MTTSIRVEQLQTLLDNLRLDSTHLYLQFGENAVWPILTALRSEADSLAWYLGVDWRPQRRRIRVLGAVITFLDLHLEAGYHEGWPGFGKAEATILRVAKAANDELNYS